MCDAELASDWSDAPGSGLWLAGDMLHDARQILSPPPVMTGSGWDVHGTPDNTLTHDTHGHTPDTGTVVSQLDHDERGADTGQSHHRDGEC